MQEKSFFGHSPLGFHRVAYTEWGEGGKGTPPLVCVHGLTRNGRDFDRLAEALEGERQLFCPDIVGRGKSDFLSDPTLYAYSQYFADMNNMIVRTGVEQIDWVGTSMGGIIGMFLAADGQSPIRRLIINDVGPCLPLSALKRIADYVALTPEFVDQAALERHLRTIYAPFGIEGAEEWQSFAKHSYRTLPNGKLTLAHDPAIACNFRTLEKDVDFWEVYDRIRCPVLVLHGTQSDVLTSEIAYEMTQRGPKAELVECPGIGHAPALRDVTQIKLIAQFLCS